MGSGGHRHDVRRCLIELLRQRVDPRARGHTFEPVRFAWFDDEDGARLDDGLADLARSFGADADLDGAAQDQEQFAGVTMEVSTPYARRRGLDVVDLFPLAVVDHSEHAAPGIGELAIRAEHLHEPLLER